MLQHIRIEIVIHVVVGINERDELACGMQQSQIARRGLALVGGMRIYLDTCILLSIMLGDSHTLVSRAIVDKDDLQCSMGLVYQGFDTLCQIFFSIVYGDYDGYGVQCFQRFRISMFE